MELVSNTAPTAPWTRKQAPVANETLKTNLLCDDGLKIISCYSNENADSTQ